MRAMESLDRLPGDEAPHPTSSEANARVRDRIRDELTAMGYPVETQTMFACRGAWGVRGDVTNIMSRLPGTSDGPAVLLTVHYDSVPAGRGAGDDMAGIAAILEVARLLRAEPPARNPIVFLFSDGEEPGQLGAEAFIEEHPHHHTPLDSLANLDPGSVQHHGDNALAATRAFASLDLSNQPAGRSVFQDLLPGLVVRWPEPWTIWLALAAAGVADLPAPSTILCRCTRGDTTAACRSNPNSVVSA